MNSLPVCLHTKHTYLAMNNGNNDKFVKSILVGTHLIISSKLKKKMLNNRNRTFFLPIEKEKGTIRQKRVMIYLFINIEIDTHDIQHESCRYIIDSVGGARNGNRRSEWMCGKNKQRKGRLKN